MTRNIIISVLVVVISIAFIYVGIQNFESWQNFTDQLELSYPVYGTGTSNGSYYVIDTSQRRVVAIDSDGRVLYEIEGGSKIEGSFFYAAEIAVDDSGHLFLLNKVLDDNGFFIIREEILEYNAEGQFVRILYQKKYDDVDETYIQRGEIVDIKIVSDNLKWYEIAVDDAVLAKSFNLENGEAISEYSRTIKDSRLVIADIARKDHESFYYISKRGHILESTRNGDKMVLDGNMSSPAIIPSELDYGQDLVFTDMGNRQIMRLESDGLVTVFNSEASGIGEWPYVYYRISSDAEGTIYAPNDEALVVINDDITTISGGSMGTPYLVFTFLRAAALPVGIIWFVIVLWFIYFKVFKKNPPPVLLRSLVALFILGLGAVVTGFITINSLNERNQGMVLDKISQMIQVAPRTINGDDFHLISKQSDFLSEPYMRIRNSFLETFNYNQDSWNQGYYFALYRVQDEQLYGMMYMNGLIGVYHPFDWLGGAEDPGEYDIAQAGGIETVLVTDISGDWIYGVGPIYDSAGNVVALFETGTDLYAMNLENQRLFENLMWELLTAVILIILVIVEFTFLSQLFKEKKEYQKEFKVSNFTRPIGFLFFAALSMSVAFIPLLSKELLPDGAADYMIALPLSAEMLFFGLATLIGGWLLGAFRWRVSFVLSILLAGAGLILSALAATFDWLLIARSLTGFGSGLGYLALRGCINSESSTKERSGVFSHFYAGMTAGINAGLLGGATLAEMFGYSNVFYFAAAVIIITLVVFIVIFRKAKVSPPEKIAESEVQGAFIKYWTDLRVWAFFILLILPTYVAGSFIGYYVPLFGNELGLGTADIGRLLIMNGLFIIYLGPPVSRLINKLFGSKKGAILGSILWGGALILSAWMNSLIGVVIALAIMGITEGFAVNSQNELYLQLPNVKKMGEDHAVGFFELFGKLGETVGPILFAASLVLGAIWGLSVMGIVVAALALPAIFIFKSRSQTV